MFLSMNLYQSLKINTYKETFEQDWLNAEYTMDKHISYM